MQIRNHNSQSGKRAKLSKKGANSTSKNRPGLIFVKVPQNWIDNIEVVKAIETIAIDFFRNTDRVVSIKFYVSHLELTNQGVHHRHAFREITNYNSRFHDGRNWNRFTGPEHREAGMACHQNGKGFGLFVILNEQL